MQVQLVGLWNSSCLEGFLNCQLGPGTHAKAHLVFRIRWCSGGGNPAWLPKCNTDSTRICANMIQVDGNTEAECKSLFHWSIRIWRGGLGSCQSYMMTSAVHSFCITHPGLHLWETHVQTDCKPPWIFFSPHTPCGRGVWFKVLLENCGLVWWRPATTSISYLLGESPMQLFLSCHIDLTTCFSPCWLRRRRSWKSATSFINFKAYQVGFSWFG